MSCVQISGGAEDPKGVHLVNVPHVVAKVAVVSVRDDRHLANNCFP